MATRNRKKKPEGTRPQSITFADAFAGIGGIHRALALAGAILAWASESNADAAETYRRNFNHDPTGDMTAVRAVAVPDHDILCAGFPCQSFSVEGKRQGMADPRGRLFYEIVRILTAKRPRAFILENVPHLLRIDGGRTFVAMRGHLTGLGYAVRHAVLDARHFGLPQRRERLFIVGILGLYRKAALPSFAFPEPGKPADGCRSPADRPLRAAGHSRKAANRPLRAADDPLKAADEPLRAVNEPLRAANRPLTAVNEPLRAVSVPLTGRCGSGSPSVGVSRKVRIPMRFDGSAEAGTMGGDSFGNPCRSESDGSRLHPRSGRRV